jgi:hypothetical protein
MRATSAAPVERVFARSAMATFPPERRSPMMPDPMIVASKNAVPSASAARRRKRSAAAATVAFGRLSFVEGLRDEQIESLFHAAREADYSALALEIRELERRIPRRSADLMAARGELESDLSRLKKRLGEIVTLDFFAAPGRVPTEAVLRDLEQRLSQPHSKSAAAKRPSRDAYKGRTWVTRKNIHVDRIASAWLVRNFIDPKPIFKFVPSQGYDAKDDEVTFDMTDGTFTHVGDKCTFEVLVDAFDLREPGLRALAEIVHDIDVKDGKFNRAEAPGVATLVAGIALTEREDVPRLALGERYFAALYEALRRKAKS